MREAIRPCVVLDPMHARRAHCAGIGRSRLWPHEMEVRSAPEIPREYHGDIHSREVGHSHSTEEAVEQRLSCAISGGDGGGKGSD